MQPFCKMVRLLSLMLRLIHFSKAVTFYIHFVGTLEDLSGDNALVLRLVGLHIRNGAGLPAPGMINEPLCIDPKQLIEQLFIPIIVCLSYGAPSNIPHSIQTVGLQLGRAAFAHPPEIRERPVVPKQAPLGHLI